MRQRKTRDTWQLWINYGQGWEHELTEYTWSEARERRKEYRENCPQYPTRIKFARERIAHDCGLDESEHRVDTCSQCELLNCRVCYPKKGRVS